MKTLLPPIILVLPTILSGSAPGTWANQYMNMFSNQSQDKYVHPALA